MATSAVLLPRHDEAPDMPDPYDASGKYSLGVVGFIAGFIVVFAIARQLAHLRQRRQSSGYSAKALPVVVAKPLAVYRCLATKQVVLPWLRWRLPVLGTTLLIAAFSVFMFIWTWSVRPYYRATWNTGSPPLAIRTGMMALGCFPFIFAFASKVNVVTFVTGVSHEKLQVYHQYLSHIFLFLSWVHTVPFLIQGLTEYKPNYSPPTLQLNYSMLVVRKVYYWTGVILLVLLAILCWGSFPVFRRRNYEVFKWLHIVSALLFIPFFFLHCNRLLGSWEYLYATAVLYGLAVIGRFIYLFLLNGAGIPRAECEVVPGGMVKLRIRSNPMDKWRPGQHYFINFLTCEPFQSHPFTLANIPTQVVRNGHIHEQEMVLIIREAAGLTQKLRSKLEKSQAKSLPVLLDGPYGGVEAEFSQYDSVLLLAGGVGITFILPILQDLVHQVEHHCICKSVELIWSVRTADSIEWIRNELETILDAAPKGFFKLDIRVTREEVEKADEYDELKPVRGRIDVSDRIHTAAADCLSLGVAVCGPASLVLDARNAVASIESNIVKGNAKGAKDVYLHSEEYSW